MAELPKWAERVLGQVESALESAGPGSLEYRFLEAESQLLVAPKAFEVVGGGEDGAEGYPFYTVRVQELVEAFDEVAEIWWDTMDDELHIEGRVGGEDVWVVFRKHPFENSMVEDLLDKGRLRKREGE